MHQNQRIKGHEVKILLVKLHICSRIVGSDDAGIRAPQLSDGENLKSLRSKATSLGVRPPHVTDTFLYVLSPQHELSLLLNIISCESF